MGRNINFFGKTTFYEGNYCGDVSQIIINGRVVNGNDENGKCKSQTFNEKKVHKANNVKKITIDSEIAEVRLLVAESSEVEAHFYGEAYSDGNMDFDVSVIDDEIKIKLTHTCSYYSGKLKLDVKLPRKDYEKVAIETISGNVEISKNCVINNIKVNTISGNVITSVTVAKADITTISGDIDFSINADKDVNLKLSSTSGDINVEFNNIKKVNISTETITGHVRKRYEPEIGYTATGKMSTVSGDITIR